MPNRILKESLCTSETISSLSDFEYRVWTSLILMADDAGRGDARSAIIKGRAFPLRERVTSKDIDAAVHGLAGKGCISLYTVGGKSYYYFPTWSEHQRVRDVKPKYPAPPENDSDVFCGGSRRTAADCGGLPPESESESEYNITFSNEKVCSTPSEVQRAVEAWNGIGLRKVTKLSPETERNKMLKKRIADYGIDNVLKAIGNVKASRFLNGDNKHGFTATFDWFIKPNNFPKVLDGNYNDEEKPKIDARAYKGAKWLAEAICERVPGFSEPSADELDRWARDMDAIHKQGYTWKQISDTAVWALDDQFWGPLIVSGEALRKNFVKMLAKEAADHD